MSSTNAGGVEGTAETPPVERDAETSGEQPSGQELPLDTIFDTLKNSRRRQVVEYLQSTDDPAELGDVSKYVASRENDKSVSDITYDERKRVYVALYQCHLPKMDDKGVIRFDKSRGQLELTEQAGQLDRYLEAGDRGRTWYRYYAATVAVGVGLAVASVFVGSLLSPSLVLGFVLASVSLCAGWHARAEKH